MTAVRVKKPRKKKPYNLKTRVTSALRKIWLYSPQRREAVNRAKANGNICEYKGCTTYQEQLECDHIVPVADLTGWDENWTAYITRLMVESDGLIMLCTPHHTAKTSIQREQRKRNKRKSEPKVKKTLTKKVK